MIDAPFAGVTDGAEDCVDGYRAGIESIAELIEPRAPLSVSEWADRHRHLVGKAAAEAGPWRTARIPFLRAIMDSLDVRHPAPLVVFVKSSQVGGSECALNWIGRTIHCAPASFLALFPTEKVARKWVRVRLDSMIATTPELRRVLPLGRRQNSANTLSEKHYPGGVLYTGSANIPDDVASVSVPNLVFDEVDRMTATIEDEGDPVELALRRSTTFPRSKALMISTPTTEEGSRIWPAWLASTMDRYYVPCVHCNAYQVLTWSGLKWAPGKPEQAAYQCQECAALIHEGAKPQILEAGEWRAEHPERESEAKGFHVNGLYTPIGLGDSWEKHARAWERTSGKAARIQVFYNTRLGIPYRGAKRRVEWEGLKSRAEPYPLRSIPPGVLVLTSHTDVQADRLETQIVGWGRGEQATVIDYQVLTGDPTRAEVWAELDAYLAREIVNAHGVAMRLSVSLVDCGYLRDHVLNFTRPRRSRSIYASRGSEIANKAPIGRPLYPDVKRRGRGVQPDKRGAERYDLGVSAIKEWLHDQLRADLGEDGELVTPARRHVRFPDALPDEYFRQLAAETFDPRTGWSKTQHERNEALDTFVGARAAAMHHRAGVHKFNEADWLRLEQLFEPKGAASGAGAPAPVASTSSGVTLDTLRAMVPRVKP